MVVGLIVESLKQSVGLKIVFWNNQGLRFEGKILACDDSYLKFYDTHSSKERFIKLEEMKEAELD